MKRLSTAFGLFAVCLGTLAHGAPTKGEDWRYKDILDLIKQKQASGHPLQSPDELLAALPDGAKSFFTFIYQSNAAFQDASPLAPRAVVFSPHLVYAFNGDAKQRGYNTIEFMELDDNNRKIELREIEFTRGPGGVEVKAPDQTPAKCLQCHGASPRPIWHEYSDWAGVYGSSDDTLNATETKNFADFVAAMKANPALRYNRLALPKDFYTGTYFAEGNYRSRINLSFTKVLARFNAVRLLGLAKQSPYYESLKWVLPGASQRWNCSKGEVSASFSDQLDKILKARGLRQPKSSFDKMMLVLDLPPARFSPQTGKDDYSYEDGSYQMVPMFFDQVSRDIAQTDTDFGKTLELNDHYYQGEWTSYPIYQTIDQVYPRVSVTNCSYLQDKSDKAQQQILPAPAPEPAHPSFEALVQRAEEVRSSGFVPVSCVYCHVVQAGQAEGGPRFAFDDAAALAVQLKADNGRLLDKMVARANPNSPDGVVMPPATIPSFNRLTQAEYSDFTTYVKGLSK